MVADLPWLFDALVIAQREIMLFVGVFLAIGALDELAVDLLFVRLLLRGQRKAPSDSMVAMAARAPTAGPLLAPVAVFIPAWQEDAVIGATVAHALNAWPQDEVRLYVGCYRNDAATVASAMAGGRGDARLRLVIHDACGPTTKSDCLNRLWAAMREDERRSGNQMRMVMLQDAEDMVDPAALAVCEAALWDADLVQLPVLALPQHGSRWVGSHYADEFAESHGKTLVVRDAMGAAIPGAGVGCAIARPMLQRLVATGDADGPFSTFALTEDYELGLRIARLGGKTRFVRARAADGRLVATRSFFPARLETAVRQKTRWIHGIALQGWDRLGWGGTIACQWMQMRDRRGPFAALLLALAYVLVFLTFVIWLAQSAGMMAAQPFPPQLSALIVFNLLAFLWRGCVRALFTAREYGWREGVLAVPRMLVGNVIAILAGRRAVLAYARTLGGAPPVWDKTEHADHPALLVATALPA